MIEYPGIYYDEIKKELIERYGFSEGMKIYMFSNSFVQEYYIQDYYSGCSRYYGKKMLTRIDKRIIYAIILDQKRQNNDGRSR